MMADAIRYVGLEPLYLQPADGNDLKATIYGYVRGGVPAVLGFNVYYPEDDPEEWKKQGHAVTVGGYRIKTDSTPVEDKHAFRVYAYRLDRLFVHDDQIGPFARMFADNETCTVMDNGKEVQLPSLGTLYPGSNGDEGKVRAVCAVVLLPLYHKIRIPYSFVHDTVFEFNAVFLELLKLSGKDWTPDLEWDIFLTTGNRFKEELSRSKAVDSARKLRYLTWPLPRFVWRAQGLVRGTPVVDLLFDATDIEQGTLFSMVVEYDPDLVGFMPMLFGQEENKAFFGDTTARRIVDWYIRAARNSGMS